ncbi:MAG: GntR family transcriptional regulator [Hyphomicrobiaceae bacterium]|nr:GntR family transcriptional regulator [Hyphomicrobiaceae bacterium]
MTSPDGSRRPRYLHVRGQLVERIRSGAWAPGQPIPSEFDIAREFGVSQGTARMAVTALVAENVVVRRQGLGTYVCEHTQEEEYARFSSVFDGERRRIATDTQSRQAVVAGANRTERRDLNLAAGAKVLRIRRVRTRDGTPFILETVSVPAALFPGLAQRETLPATLYELYQKSYGVLVVRAEERLTAIAADRAAAKTLRVAAGAPLLRIERTAFALEGRPVECRVSLCYLADAHYLARLK